MKLDLKEWVKKVTEAFTTRSDSMTGTATTGSISSVTVRKRSGICSVNVTVTSGSSAVSAGGNVCVGTISGDYLPLQAARGINYYSGTALIGALSAAGSFSVRAIGGSFPANTSTTISFVYVGGGTA